MKQIVYFIMAGGQGMRLWPLSRANFPKQLHCLYGNSSLLQQSITRVLPISKADKILIGTKEAIYPSVKQQWEQLIPETEPWMILEPESRNTAPAIALAILACRERFNRDVILVSLAADQIIKDIERFQSWIKFAAQVAAGGRIITFGIVPDNPETGYGYIKSGKKIIKNLYNVAQFKEKPDLKSAKRYLKSVKYLWNSGMFVFDTKVAANSLKELTPDLWAAAQNVWAKRKYKGESVFFAKKDFCALPDISLDYAIMEKSDNLAVIKADFKWSDLGSWQKIDDLALHNAEGNVFSGNVLGFETKNTFIKADKRLVAALCVDDLVVVDTPDALLITKKNCTQNVKQIVNVLNQKKSDLTQTHTTVHKPWGNYTILDRGEGYLMKRLIINPGQKLSLQKHRFRREHWFVACGKAEVVKGKEHFLLKTNQSIFIPKLCKHRVTNSFKNTLVIIEVQTGSLLKEDDIIRYADIYGRV
ncbi:MAG: mannose-1-phosphate guanylyltransferase/mannose-6-phosphate isomerase [Candidatus Omnitrophota bacterium]|nr:MAG: mannose-1-phosphate guanylyltransferase/mannose-6-phosphate isomerase [Candidatus Omnitrophota bacterium]